MKHDFLNMFRQLPPNSKNCVYVIFSEKLEYGGLMSAAERRRNAIFEQDSNPLSPRSTTKNLKKYKV